MFGGVGGSPLQTDGHNGEALAAGRSAASLTPNVLSQKKGQTRSPLLRQLPRYLSPITYGVVWLVGKGAKYVK